MLLLGKYKRTNSFRNKIKLYFDKYLYTQKGGAGESSVNILEVTSCQVTKVGALMYQGFRAPATNAACKTFGKGPTAMVTTSFKNYK